MNTKYLTTLVTILETGSFQKAAVLLSYTQSAITSQIQQLEEELGVKLFEKIGRRMQLTQAGKDLLPYMRSILQNVERIENYHKDASEIRGTLRLVAPDSIFIYKLQPIIREIRRRAPQLRLIVSSLPSEEINGAIVSGIADIAVDCDKGNFPDSVVHEPATPCKACLIAPPDLSLSDADFITPHQRKRFGLVLNEPKAHYQAALTAYLARKDIILEADMNLRSIEAVKRSVMNGLGVAYVPDFAVCEELESGVLRRLATELDEVNFPAAYLYHKNKWISPQMELCFRILREHIGVTESAE